MNQISISNPTTLPTALSIDDLARLRSQVDSLAASAVGAGTRRAHNGAWRQFRGWCARLCLDPFVVDNIPLYVGHLAERELSVSTIRVALAAIAAAYRRGELPLDLREPRLAAVIEGAARRLGTAPRRQATPVSVDLLRAMINHCNTDSPALAAHGQAMLLIGFGAALRRSEVVRLCVGDVAPVEGMGVTVTIRRSKTDQRGEGRQVAIWSNRADQECCPAHALETWLIYRRRADDLSADCTDDRPLFCAIRRDGRITGDGLSDKAVARLVKDMARRAGCDPIGFSGHSLRAGLITAAAEAGAELPGVMRQARHVAPATTMRYYRPSDLWKNNVTAGIFGERRHRALQDLVSARFTRGTALNAIRFILNVRINTTNYDLVDILNVYLYTLSMNLMALNAVLQKLGGQRHWCVSDHSLRLFFHNESRNTFNTALSRHVRAGLMTRLSPGLYLNPYAQRPLYALENLSCFLRPFDFFYLSLESALHESGHISQIPSRLTFMTDGPSYTYETPLGIIEFTHTKRPVDSWLCQTERDAERGFRVATTELALSDLRHVRRSLDLLEHVGEEVDDETNSPRNH